ncbi:homocysteine biosynthesis protein [Breznakiella homolactica]|uniref:Homocysteine biosynthesis protein n=1 Tax=Breznakiella homolactica TaxID=2798577 RepID=A0A7T8B8N1_9SPIR|nr:homocysteine biosynthesis protein [Breznakiella homolactica]QQO07491.1 homocysteine biosynthesis protein [Breznakiella homolactica]
MKEHKKSWEEINKKIAQGSAVVITAEEAAEMSREKSPGEIAKTVDVVTTGTFGAMCSSGMFINFGHPEPPIRMEKLTLDDVPVFGGIAAVDAYIGATEVHPDYPDFGGAHIIERLVSGEEVFLKAHGKGTDCYPRRDIETWVHKDRVNEMILTNPRNAYQNYPAAGNSTHRTLYTYMGTLLPSFLNINYSTSGCLSPLLNDPWFRTIGIGSPVFIGGTIGSVAWNGTQFNTEKPRNKAGIPLSNAGTLMLVGNAREMTPEWLRAAYYHKYGTTLYLGIGFAIPVLDEDMARHVSVRNEEIETTVCDYGADGHPGLFTANYRDLMSGSIEMKGKKVRTAPLSSFRKARILAETLKTQVLAGEFPIAPPARSFPEHSSVQGLTIVKHRRKKG